MKEICLTQKEYSYRDQASLVKQGPQDQNTIYDTSMSYLGSPESECTYFTCCSLCLIEVLKALMRIDLWCNARDIVIYLNKQRNKNAKNNIKLKSGTLSPMFITIFIVGFSMPTLIGNAHFIGKSKNYVYGMITLIYGL